MPPEQIYLDHNSTTPIDPRVVETMTRAWSDCGANPASQHALGRKARRMLEGAREGISELLGAKTGGMDADQLIFTSGGTEANNLALLGLTLLPSAALLPPVSRRVVTSTIEHPSILSAADQLRHRKYDVQLAPVSEEGSITSNSILNLFNDRTLRVSVMLANNETGVIQPVAEIAALCRERGVPLHTDAVQAVGKIPVSFRDLGVDCLTVAPHKFHGPLGIGALLLRHGVKLKPQLFGGFQQAALRPGTENLALAVGFHAALKLAIDELPVRCLHMQSLRDQLEASLRAELPDMVIVGEHTPRLPNTSCIAFPGLDRQALVMALDLAGVACSTGSACASGSSEPSPTLVAMGLPKDVIEGAIRFSLSTFTTAAEMAEASRRIIKAVKHLR